MTAAPTEVPDVVKKRSESRRFNTLVRLDDDLVEKAKKVAALKGISLAEYFSDALRPIVDRDMTREIKKLAKEEGGTKE
jgi:Arc/MetJ family transcription regulator